MRHSLASILLAYFIVCTYTIVVYMYLISFGYVAVISGSHSFFTMGIIFFIFYLSWIHTLYTLFDLQLQFIEKGALHLWYMFM